MNEQQFVMMYKVGDQIYTEDFSRYPFYNWKYEVQLRDVEHGKTITNKKAIEELYKLHYTLNRRTK